MEVLPIHCSPFVSSGQDMPWAEYSSGPMTWRRRVRNLSKSKVSMWHLQLSNPLGRELITPWGYPFCLNENWTQNEGKWPKNVVISSVTMFFPVVGNHLGWKGWQRDKDKTTHYSFSFYTILTTSKPKVQNIGRIYAYKEVKWKQLSIACVAFTLLWWRIKYACIPELGHANSVIFRDSA